MTHKEKKHYRMRNNLYICNANPQTKTTLISHICGSNFGTHYTYENCCLYLNTYNYNRCLSPTELNWYLDNILGYIDIYESYYNKYIVDFELRPGEILGVKVVVPDVWIMDIYLGDINYTNLPMDD